MLTRLTVLSRVRAPVTNAEASGSPACYPVQHFVTKAGSYGNEIEASNQQMTTHKNYKPLIYMGFKNMARVMLYCWHNNNNKHHPE